MLSPRAALCKSLLEGALPLIATHGFSNALLAGSLHSYRLHAGQRVEQCELRQIFPRGFPIAVVEHIVKLSNQRSIEHLEQNFSTRKQIDRVKGDMNSFLKGELIMPCASDIADAALGTKIRVIEAYISRWPEAVALQLRFSNLPFALIHMAEFADNTSYYIDRIANLSALLEPARCYLLNKHTTLPHYAKNAVDQQSHVCRSSAMNANTHGSFVGVIDGFVSDSPLSTTPRNTYGSLNAPWFLNRAKIMLQYTSTLTSLIGDTPCTKTKPMRTSS